MMNPHTQKWNRDFYEGTPRINLNSITRQWRQHRSDCCAEDISFRRTCAGLGSAYICIIKNSRIDATNWTILKMLLKVVLVHRRARNMMQQQQNTQCNPTCGIWGG